VEANDAGAICEMGTCYYNGLLGCQQDETKAIELWMRAAELGFSKAHGHLGNIYHEGGDMRKAKFHMEAAAMAGNEVARCKLGILEENSGNKEQAVKHWKIAASAGSYIAMDSLQTCLKKGHVSRQSINSTLIAYNDSCAKMRSKARDAAMRVFLESIG
jgi:TPR repeat protein